jgi:hypothetical protein
MKNAEMKAVTIEIEAAGLDWYVNTKGRHPKVIFTINGRSCQMTVSSTPSDWRGPLNARAQVRRVIRQARSAAVSRH